MIEVQVLGGLRVFRDGVELEALAAKPKCAPLLVSVVVEGTLSREEACDLVWSDNAPRRARRALSQALVELKKDLGPEWIETPGQLLRATGQVAVDIRALREAESAGNPIEVVDRFRGDFLEGVRLKVGTPFERWVDQQRTDLTRTLRAAFRRLLGPDRPAEIDRAAYARRWIEHDPLEDEAHHALIEALWKDGHRREALEHFSAYSALIREELDLEPLDATVELAARIAAGAEHGEAPSEPRPEVTLPEALSSDSLAPTEPEEPAMLDEQLRVVRLIAEGSTGPVFLAREADLRRPVAVKVLRSDLAEYPTARARFIAEAQLMVRVFHDNITPVHRVGLTPDGRPFIVLHYHDGVTLAERLRAHGAFDSDEVRQFVSEVAAALAAAHKVGVLHRDVRPANVIFDETLERTFLMDFGVAVALESADEETARLTRSGELLGNPTYISPEQARGESLTDRSDVYSLGVLGWELLMGRPTTPGVASGSGPWVDPELTDVLRRATAKNPRHRPSAAHIAEVLAAPRAETGGASFLRQLVARRLPQFVGVFLAGGLAGMEGVDQLVQQGILPPLAYRLALAAFVAGLNGVIVVGWFHGKKGRQAVSPMEVVLLAVIAVAWCVASVLIFQAR